MLEIIGLLILGIVSGRLLRNVRILGLFSNYVSVTVCLLILSLGITVGSNENVVSEFGKVFSSSILLGVCGFAGSVAGAYWIGKILKRK